MGLLGILESVLAGLHLMAVGVASVGPLVCLWLEWREHRFADAAAGEAGRRLARLTLDMIWIGSLLGLAALGLLWLNGAGEYFQAFSIIPPRRLMFGLGELAFYAACMFAYLRWWKELPRWAHRSLAVLAATNVLYHFPPLFAAVTVISTRADLLTPGRPPLEVLELLKIFVDSETLSRIVHAVLAACVVTGVAMMGISLRLRRDGDENAAKTATWGGRLALAAGLFQLPIGVWVLLNLPAAVRDQFMMADFWTTLLFSLSVLVMLTLLHHLAAVALGETDRGVLTRCMLLTAVLFVSMVAAGHQARAARNENVTAEFTGERRTQWIPTKRSTHTHASRSAFRIPHSDFPNYDSA